jgi:hypothetical protein
MIFTHKKYFLCKKDCPNLLNFQKKITRFLQQVPACSQNEFLKISTFIISGQWANSAKSSCG